MPFEVFPYTNFHELNLDTIIDYVTQIKTKVDDVDSAVEQSQINAENAQNSAAEAAAETENVRNIAAEMNDELVQWNANVANLSAQVDNNTANIATQTTRIDDIISGTTPDANAELIDIRVAYDGLSYTTAGESVRKQVKEVRDAVVMANSTGRQTFNLYSAFDHYGLNTSGGFETSQTYRVSCERKITFDHDIVVTVQDGFRWGYIPFTNNTAGSWSGWKKGYTIIPANTTFVVQIARITEDTSEVANVDEFVSAITFESYVTPVKDNTNKINSIGTLSSFDISNMYVWEYGSISGGGANTYDYHEMYLRTDFTDISGITKINFNILNNYRFGWHLYDANKNHISSASEWVTTSYSLEIPANVKYLRINMTLDSTTNLNYSAVHNLESLGEFAIVEMIRTLSGEGNTSYIGEKISISPADVIRYCDINIHKNYSNTEYSDLADYSLNNHQSIAIFNDHMFLLNTAGRIVVANLNDGNIIGLFNTGLTTRNHQNSAQFSNIYYDINDEYPLLFIGRCGNSTEAGDYDTCLIYRVVNINNQFTFTLINTITTDITTYGNDWFIDVASNSIGMCGYVNGFYSVTVNNPIKFFKWNMPGKNEILSGNTILLSINDITGYAECDHMYLQSACGYDNKIFFVTSSTNKLHVMDMNNGKLIAAIDLPGYKEAEGVAIYDGLVYTSEMNVSDTTGSNPLTIYSIQF